METERKEAQAAEVMQSGEREAAKVQNGEQEAQAAEVMQNGEIEAAQAAEVMQNGEIEAAEAAKVQIGEREAEVMQNGEQEAERKRGRKRKKVQIGEDKHGDETRGERHANFEKGNSITVKYKGEYCDAIIKYFKEAEGFPTFELFADSIGVTERTLRNWAEKYKHFSVAWERAKGLQKGRAIEGGMLGRYNANMVKFLAVNCFGMVEKVESDTTVRFDITLPDGVDEECD